MLNTKSAKFPHGNVLDKTSYLTLSPSFKKCRLMVSSNRGFQLAVVCWVLLVCPGASAAPLPRPFCPGHCQCLEGASLVLCGGGNLTGLPGVAAGGVRFQKAVILLQADHNAIFQISNNSLRALVNLEMLSLAHNRISLIDTSAFHNLVKLRSLSLRHNRIGLLPKNIFQNNNNLQVLDLSHNLLYYIPHEAIFYLFNLQVLNISYNSIGTSYLGTGFRYTTHLQMLDLTGNQLPSIDMDSFQAVVWWDDMSEHFINLSYCNVRHIHRNAFKDLTHITGLSLRGNDQIPGSVLRNSLTDIPTQTFTSLDLSNMSIPNLRGYFKSERFNNLVDLNLSQNVIKVIEAGTLSFMDKLLNLDLSYNRISSIQSLTGLDHLEVLNLNHNRISKINMTTFDNLENLKTLYLAYNNLTTLSGQPFQNLWFLETWDISHNKINNFNLNLGFNEHLKSLNIANNQLTSIDFVAKLPRIQEVDISNNPIGSLSVETFSRGQVVRKFNASHCGISHVDPLTFHPSGLRVLDLSHNALRQVAHFGWTSPLKELYLSHNNITYLAENSFEGLNSLEMLDLSHCGLYSFPLGTFNDLYQLRRLDVSNNPLGTFITASMARFVFQNMESLEKLNLAQTNLQQFPAELFENRITLREIDLSDNQISTVIPESFQGIMNIRKVYLSKNWISSFNSFTFSQLTSLETIDISQNPFKCTCDFKTSCDWLLSTYVDIINFASSSSSNTLCYNEDISTNNGGSTYSASTAAQTVSSNSDLVSKNLNGVGLRGSVSLHGYCSTHLPQTCDAHYPNTVFWAVIAAISLIAILVIAIVIYKLCTRSTAASRNSKNAAGEDKRKQSQKMLDKFEHEKELEREQERMIFENNFKYKYSINSMKEDKL